jgi:hypothetical protein
MKAWAHDTIRTRDGHSVEGFRYYRGLPDSIGK